MAIFEIGQEYWLSYGDAEQVDVTSVKVLEVDGTWIRVETDKLDPMLNMAAPLYLSAKPRDREAEFRADMWFRPTLPPGSPNPLAPKADPDVL